MSFFSADGHPRDFVFYLDLMGSVETRNIVRAKIDPSGGDSMIMVTTDWISVDPSDPEHTDFFETVIVGGNSHGYVATYATEEEAVVGHDVAFQMVMTGD